MLGKMLTFIMVLLGGVSHDLITRFCLIKPTLDWRCRNKYLTALLLLINHSSR